MKAAQRKIALRLSLGAFIAVLGGCSRGVEQREAGTPDPESEWRVLGNGANAQHYSPIDQINARTVSRLGLAWVAEIPSQDGLSGNPLVAGGIVFQGGPMGRVYANDLKTGKQVWVFDPQIQYTRAMSLATNWSLKFNRGLALLDDKVIIASGDCHLWAVDQKSGVLVWDTQSCDPREQYGITGAPRVGAGLVFIGNNCIDSGETRGFVDAFDGKTGVRKWRFYTVPGDPAREFESDLYRKAAESWGTDWYGKTHGCGSVWDAMTYDEELNLLYMGVGVPAPWSPARRASDAGDELFSGSIVAVNASTGEYVWHFKVAPNDGWNMHPSMHIMVADLPIDGKTRRVVMQAPKNGFFYVLDARTGEFIQAKDYLPQDLILSLDPETGRPTYNPEAQYWIRPGESVVVSPGPLGVHNWMAMAFNPGTGLVYFPAQFIPTLFTPDPRAQVGGMLFDMYYGLREDAEVGVAGYLMAWDPVAQKVAWRAEQKMPWNGGALATGGNLVFQGTAVGTFNAYAADSGELLWSYDTKESIVAAPSTVKVDGTQYVLVAVGNGGSFAVGSYLATHASTLGTRGPSRLLAFTLDGKVPLPPFEPKVIPRPPVPPQPEDLAARGRIIYEQTFCADCHGLDGASASGKIKDLRFMTAETHRSFAAIVIGGAFYARGMPGFQTVSTDDAKAMQAWLTNRAWEDYNKQEGQLPAPQKVK